MKTGPRSGINWTPDTIVYAITLWHRRHNRLPLRREWEKAGEDHPSNMTVRRVFGSWNEAIHAAGFKPRPRGGRGRSADPGCSDDRDSRRETRSAESGVPLSYRESQVVRAS